MGNRRVIIGGVAAAIVATAAGAAPAHADAISAADPNNVALTSRGASFVAASSANQALLSGDLSQMQINPISVSPLATFSNGDWRYVFTDPWDGSGNPPNGDQTYEIRLGALYDLNFCRGLGQQRSSQRRLACRLRLDGRRPLYDLERDAERQAVGRNGRRGGDHADRATG